MFNFDRFVQDCKSAVGETGAQMAVKALVEQAVSTPRELVAAIGEPERVGIAVGAGHYSAAIIVSFVVFGVLLSMRSVEYKLTKKIKQKTSK